MDVLTDVLSTLQLTGSLYFRTELAAPWGMRFAPPMPAMFHVVAEGTGWLTMDDEATSRPLQAGEVVLLPHGDGHALSDDPASPLVAIPIDATPRRACQVLRYGEQPAALLLCGTFHFGHPRSHPLLALLPPVIHLPGAASAELAATLTAIGTESGVPRPGAETILRRLADVLFVQIIRAWIEGQPPAWAAGGWLGALRDPQIGAALGAMHRQPAHPWTVAELAQVAALSRTSFATRFAALVGAPPAQYLTRWRMHLATLALRQEPIGLLEVAHRVGYDSEAALSKAFKREFGMPPGTYRRLA